jgi:hypothetical protein
MASMNVSHNRCFFFYFQVIQERKLQREFSENSVNEELETGKFILVSWCITLLLLNGKQIYSIKGKKCNDINQNWF